MKNLIQKVEQWAEERGIYEHSTAMAQINGAIAELYEFREAMIKEKSLDEKRLELGDVVVQLINFCKLDGSYLPELDNSIIEPPIDREAIFIETVYELCGDELGRVINYLASMAEFFCYCSLEECLEQAYEKIKDRKGTMQNGKFVKEPME